ncbi:MAG: hypothetical protein P8L85_02130 [Rubripirellula sp.]|nr:hypothetical protein [Rubripirellula sp.]
MACHHRGRGYRMPLPPELKKPVPARAIAVAPDTRAGMYEAMCRAVIDGGGTLADISVAEGLVWSDPARPEAFPSLVAEASRLEWIQLPYAGIEPFSRRVSGVYSNQLARENPNRAHALASLLPSGEYLVSVRAPLASKEGADELCRQFPTGGGRKAAAGINQLPGDQFDTFLEAMQKQFG